MSMFEDYFDRVFCINLDRSPERWAHVQQQCQQFGLSKVTRFSGFDFLTYADLPDGHRQSIANALCGCTTSHGSLFHNIAFNGWDKVLVLEDDFEIIHEDFHAKFESLIKYVPSDWELLYLGAHYGDKPLGRVNEHVVKAGYIKTTSSYAIRGPYARYLAPFMCGCNAPDDLLSAFNQWHRVYVLQPRLMKQYNCMSVIWGKHVNNGPCMEDTRHEQMV